MMCDFDVLLGSSLGKMILLQCSAVVIHLVDFIKKSFVGTVGGL